MTSDTDKARAFYTQLFGWEAEDSQSEFGGYFNFTKDGVRIAGCMPREEASPVPDVWSIYLASSDAKESVDAARANGGQVIVEPMDVADLGTMAVVVDPGGASVGIWQPGTHPGFRTLTEAGAPSWFELHTRDYDKALDFYRTVFNWNTHVEGDAPEFRYTTVGDGDERVAGVMDATAFLPEGVPAHWSVYIGTDDADATLAKIVELGGSVVVPAEDTPYGRLATAADPTGAQFKLIAPNEAMPGPTSAN
jgi:predicted enzyme related to lactoylglutathione lyase